MFLLATIIISVGSLVISIFSLINSLVTRNYQKKKDSKILKPQLFLESQKKQTTDYIDIDWEIDGYEKLQEYAVFLKFINITDVKIVDLSISVDVRKDDTFDYLLQKALEETENNFYLEKDESGNDSYSWDKVLGLVEKTEERLSVLEGGGSFDLYLPSIFSALLLGSMYSNRKGFKKSDSKIEFDINISYKHGFSKKDEYVEIKKTFAVNITYEHMIQGPHVVYDSIVFEQL